MGSIGNWIGGLLGGYGAIQGGQASQAAGQAALQQAAIAQQLANLAQRQYEISEPPLISSATGQLQRNAMMEQGLPALLNYAIGRLGTSSAAYQALPGLRTQSGQVDEAMGPIPQTGDQSFDAMMTSFWGGGRTGGTSTGKTGGGTTGGTTGGSPQRDAAPSAPIVPEPATYNMTPFPAATGAISDPSMENLVMERARTDIERQQRSAMGGLATSLGDRFGLASSAPTALAAGLSSLAAQGQEGMMNARLGLVQQAQQLEAQRYNDLVQTMLGIGGLTSGQLNLAGQNASSMYGTAAGAQGQAAQLNQQQANMWGNALQGIGQYFAMGNQQQPLMVNLGGLLGQPAQPTNPTNPYHYYEPRM